jgi:hypothetical protein
LQLIIGDKNTNNKLQFFVFIIDKNIILIYIYDTICEIIPEGVIVRALSEKLGAVNLS